MNGGFARLVEVLDAQAAMAGGKQRTAGRANELRTKSLWALCRLVRVLGLASAIGLAERAQAPDQGPGPLSVEQAEVLKRTLQLPKPHREGVEDDDAAAAAGDDAGNTKDEGKGSDDAAATAAAPAPVAGPAMPPGMGGDEVGAGVPMGPALPAHIAASTTTSASGSSQPKPPSTPKPGSKTTQRLLAAARRVASDWSSGDGVAVAADVLKQVSRLTTLASCLRIAENLAAIEEHSTEDKELCEQVMQIWLLAAAGNPPAVAQMVALDMEGKPFATGPAAPSRRFADLIQHLLLAGQVSARKWTSVALRRAGRRLPIEPFLAAGVPTLRDYLLELLLGRLDTVSELAGEQPALPVASFFTVLSNMIKSTCGYSEDAAKPGEKSKSAGEAEGEADLAPAPAALSAAD